MPESRVYLAVSVDSLLKLPDGAAYRESRDRAHVEATHRDGVIYITGTCDSLQRQVEYYEALYHKARYALEQTRDQLTTERQKRSEPLGNPILIFVLGCIAGVLMTITIIITKRHGKE